MIDLPNACGLGNGRGGRGGVGRGRGGRGVGRGRRGGRGCGGRGRGGRGRGGRGRGGRGRGSRGCGTGNIEIRNWTEKIDDDNEIVVEPFTNTVGPNVCVSNMLELFFQFFTMDIIGHIVTETNRYAKICIECSSNDNTWETSEEEIIAYLGFTIIMGLNQLPHIYDYWSTDSVFHNFYISSRISRARFLEIKRYLHFVDNTTLVSRGESGYDKLGKVREISKRVRKQTIDNYNTHKENAIDEAMIKYKGHSSLKQYLPKKPIRRGIKVWVRADSCNGYVSDFEVYTGKNGDTVTTNLGGSVVMKLSKNIISLNHHLYFDNYFTSVPLMEDLLKDKIYSCGTFRRDWKHIPGYLKYLHESKHILYSKHFPIYI